jgi:ribosome-associated protein
MAAKHKAGDLKAIDVRNLTVVADAFVICSAASEPQMRAISNEVREGMRELGVSPLHSEGSYDGNWLVIDYGTVIFHLFRQEAREFYDLDDLWGDAAQIALDV